MTWTELVETMLRLGFSPGEALVLAAVVLQQLRDGRRLRKLEHQMSEVRQVIGLQPLAGNGERHG